MKLNFNIILFFSAIAIIGCSVQEPPSSAARHRAGELIDQGVIALENGDLERAQAAFEVAGEVAQIPQSADGLGCVAFLKGDLDLAERYFLQAYDIDPTYDHVLGNLALLYEERGETERAHQFYESALTRSPESFQYRNNFAVFLEQRLQAKAEARAQLKKGEALLPHPLIEANLEAIEE